MTEKEYKLMQWPNEGGTPNILNQALRSKQNIESIKDNKKSDEVYQEGLKQLQNRKKTKNLF